MKFKTWVNEDNATNPFEQFLAEVARQAIASMREEKGRMKISFPNYQAIANQLEQATVLQHPAIQQQHSPIALAAHTLHEGRPKKPGSEEDWEKRHKKGWQAYKALGKLTDPEQLGWSGRETGQFKRTMTARIRDIAQPMGFLFEAEVFFYLTNTIRLHDSDAGAMGVNDQHQKHTNQLRSQLGQTVEQIIQFVKIHAKDMGDQIVTRTVRVLGCADMIWFQGGSERFQKTRANPADIVVGCSTSDAERDRVGYSLKFGSETRIGVLSLSLPSALRTLMGTDDENKIERLLANLDYDQDWKSWTAEVSEILYDAAVRQFDNKPRKFVNLLNNVLTSGKDVSPAARNYASTEMGGAEWSGNMKKDFNTTNTPGKPLGAKKGATVDVDVTASYLRMTYKVSGGSNSGTSMFFIPNTSGGGSIRVKVTNLTSSRR